jgi:hypothetical protein
LFGHRWCSVIGQDTLGVWFLEWQCYFVLVFYCDIWWVPVWYPLGMKVKKVSSFMPCHAMQCPWAGALPYKWKLHVLGYILQLVLLWPWFKTKIDLLGNCLEVGGSRYQLPKPLFYLGEETGNEAVHRTNLVQLIERKKIIWPGPPTSHQSQAVYDLHPTFTESFIKTLA